MAAWIVSALTYAAIGIGRLPFFRIDRPSAALLGALGMVAVGAVPLQRAWEAVDVSTLALVLELAVGSTP